jgi:hypothetical protein
MHPANDTRRVCPKLESYKKKHPVARDHVELNVERLLQRALFLKGCVLFPRGYPPKL